MRVCWPYEWANVFANVFHSLAVDRTITIITAISTMSKNKREKNPKFQFITLRSECLAFEGKWKRKMMRYSHADYFRLSLSHDTHTQPFNGGRHKKKWRIKNRNQLRFCWYYLSQTPSHTQTHSRTCARRRRRINDENVYFKWKYGIPNANKYDYDYHIFVFYSAEAWFSQIPSPHLYRLAVAFAGSPTTSK